MPGDEKVRDHVLRAIADRQYRPGDRLPTGRAWRAGTRRPAAACQAHHAPIVSAPLHPVKAASRASGRAQRRFA